MAYALILYGNLKVGQMHQRGWAARFVGESIWVIIGFYLGSTSIILWGIVFSIIDIKTWMKWREENAI